MFNWPSIPQARARYEEALPIYRTIGARLGEANCIKSLGDVHVQLAEYPAGRARYEEALPIYRTIGARLGEAGSYLGLARAGGGPDFYEHATRLHAEIGSSYDVAVDAYYYGLWLRDQERGAEALAQFAQAEEIWRRLGLTGHADTAAQQIVRTQALFTADHAAP